MTQELIIFTGNIGTGKSTLAAKYAKRGYVVVNMDTITRMIGGGDYGLYDTMKKDIYRAVVRRCVGSALYRGFSVVVDRTNMSAGDRSRYIDMGDGYKDLKIISMDFGIGSHESVLRRINDPHRIPADQWYQVHASMTKRYQKPTLEEGFHECRQAPEKYRFTAVDFDGTVVENAWPDIGLIRQVMVDEMRRLYQDDINIVIVWTCRHGDDVAKIKKFMIENNIPFDYINENPLFDTGSRKIFAHEYYDDRNAIESWHEVKCELL